MAHSRDLVVPGDDTLLFLTERSLRTQPDLAPPARQPGDLVGYSLALLLVGLFACLVVRDQRFRAPLGWDEWLTVEGYTWVGVTEDGEQRHVRRVEDFEAIPNPSLRNLAIGLYCALGRWPEPNNHVIHSALLNIALAGGRTAVMSRIPALVGAMVFGLVMFHLCWTIVGWRRAAFPVLVLAIGWPYTINFAMVARGYTWALALQALWCVLAVKTLRQPQSILRGAMMAASAVASFVNVVSSAIMWVLPAYAGLLIAKASDRIDRLSWRRNLTVQILAIAALGMMFLVDRLPAIYSASQQYGSPFASAEQAMAGLRELGATLFPSFVWAALAAIGVIGLAASSRHPIGRLFARIAVVIAITDCLYILYSARLPYPRVMFQFIPVVLIGIAWVIEDVVGRSIGARGKYLGGAVTIMTVAIVVAAQPAKDASADEQRELIERFASRDASGEVLTYPVFGRGVDAVAAAHQTPRRWLDVDARIPDGIPLRVAIFTRQAHAMSGIDFSAPPGVPSLWDHWRWTRPGARRTPPERNDNTASIHGRTYAWPNSGLTDERRMLFWYPDAERLGATASSATALVEASRLRYLAIATRRAVKLDLYSRLFVVIMLAETADQVRSADTAIHAAIEKFGGSAVIFVSDTQ